MPVCIIGVHKVLTLSYQGRRINGGFKLLIDKANWIFTSTAILGKQDFFSMNWSWIMWVRLIIHGSNHWTTPHWHL